MCSSKTVGDRSRYRYMICAADSRAAAGRAAAHGRVRLSDKAAMGRLVRVDGRSALSDSLTRRRCSHVDARLSEQRREQKAKFPRASRHVNRQDHAAVSRGYGTFGRWCAVEIGVSGALRGENWVRFASWSVDAPRGTGRVLGVRVWRSAV